MVSLVLEMIFACHFIAQPFLATKQPMPEYCLSPAVNETELDAIISKHHHYWPHDARAVIDEVAEVGSETYVKAVMGMGVAQ